ncbi:threonine ammonia-lyase [Streptomyces sp. SP17KL33]|uniref:threonine ammonia-lyase n=1 Tax=Streptomyces sp. SP17KL33 TaxID=3002534 RepID=UPI002E7696E5|nr:threonine/serine dehydratase [Streptomyces sp. SP17KL33]
MASTEVQRAVQRLRGVVVRTPLLTSPAVDARLGRRVWVKAENLQRTGSFKLRGAYNAVVCLEESRRAAGVLAASSGNHGHALALAASLHQVQATVVIPADAPVAKRGAIEALGARIVCYDRRRQRRDEIVHRIAQRDGSAIVPSADDPMVVAGAGTVGWEMLQEVHELAAILVPVGGGGLAAGVALAASGQGVKVFGVEPEAADDTFQSLRAGHLVPIPSPVTVADGLGHTQPAGLPFEINRRLLCGVITVPEQAIGEAMAYLWRHYRSAAEPSGAVAFAGLLHAADRLPEGPVGVVLSGGNVDWPAYRRLLDIALERTEGNSDATPASVLR